VNPAQYEQHTYNGGTCALSDVQIDAARVMTALGFAEALNGFAAQPQTECFNYTEFAGALSQYLVAAPVLTAGYGIGSYDSLTDAAEYLAMYSPILQVPCTSSIVARFVGD